MASAIRAWGDRKPNAIRVSKRILVLTDSISALDRLCSSAAWILSRTAVMRLARCPPSLAARMNNYVLIGTGYGGQVQDVPMRLAGRQHSASGADAEVHGRGERDERAAEREADSAGALRTAWSAVAIASPAVPAAKAAAPGASTSPAGSIGREFACRRTAG